MAIVARVARAAHGQAAASAQAHKDPTRVEHPTPVAGSDLPLVEFHLPRKGVCILPRSPHPFTGFSHLPCALSWSLVAVSQFSLLVFVRAHWLACIWGYVGIASSEPWESYATGISWRQKANIPEEAHALELYAVSLFVALNNIFGSGSEIAPSNYVEFGLQSAMIFVGASMWAYVLGSMSGLKATADPTGTAHHQTMDEVNLFCAEQQLPDEMSIRLREYFRSLLPFDRSRSYDRLLERMSTRLRGDTRMLTGEFRLQFVPFLVHPALEPEFLSYLASRFRRGVYARVDRVSCNG